MYNYMGKDNLKSSGPITIKDISERLYVSSVSVHRALAGKEGVSEKLRNQIVQTAKEMGYEFNYAAASLKRKTCRVAAVLPQDNGLYFDYIWKGLNASAKEVKGLNVEVEEMVCMDEEHQYELLKKIADAGTRYTGVVTFSYTRRRNVLMQFQRLVTQGVMTVVIDDELAEPEGLYCIPCNEKSLGHVAAEFLSLITPETGSVLVSRGRPDSKIHANKVESFIYYLNEKKPNLKVHIVEGYFNNRDEVVCEAIYRALMENPDTVACYALTAHENSPMVQAVQKAGMEEKVSVIGTDLNDITTHLLKTGQLKAVINQAAYMKGYTGLNILVDRMVKNIEPPLRIDCPIDIILQSNLSFFERSDNIIAWR